MYEDAGGFGIAIFDRPEHLGIYLGDHYMG